MQSPYFVCLFLLFVAPQSQAVRIQFDKNPKAVFQAEVVQTPKELEQGLMFRKSMPLKSGMLFIFPNEQVRYFWMKNTLIPLDMIFMNSHKKIISIVYQAIPQTTDFRGTDQASQYVLEINAGQAKKTNLKIGSQARW